LSPETGQSWANDLGTYDLILANPPYVETGAEIARQVRDHEPAGALFAGADGLDDYRILIPQLRALLAPEGIAVIEIGHTQGGAVSRIASASGLAATARQDLAGHPRALELRRDGDISLGNGPRGH
jgi:release factor glutamine methyltransferase